MRVDINQTRLQQISQRPRFVLAVFSADDSDRPLGSLGSQFGHDSISPFLAAWAFLAGIPLAITHEVMWVGWRRLVDPLTDSSSNSRRIGRIYLIEGARV